MMILHPTNRVLILTIHPFPVLCQCPKWWRQVKNSGNQGNDSVSPDGSELADISMQTEGTQETDRKVYGGDAANDESLALVADSGPFVAQPSSVENHFENSDAGPLPARLQQINAGRPLAMETGAAGKSKMAPSGSRFNYGNTMV